MQRNTHISVKKRMPAIDLFFSFSFGVSFARNNGELGGFLSDMKLDSYEIINV